MPKLVKVSEAQDPSTAVPMVEETLTRKTTGTLPLMPPPSSAPPNPLVPPKETPNEWWAKLSQEERANEWRYYPYRIDKNIIIPTDDPEGKYKGVGLGKLSPEDIASMGQGLFMDEMGVLLKEKFGGGKFKLIITHRKASLMKYSKFFEIEGAPRLIDTEQYVAGAPQPGQSGDMQTMLPMLMRMIDEKLSSISAGRADPGQAVAAVTSAVMDANNKALGFIMENLPKAASPTAQLEQMKMLLELAKNLMPPQPAPGQAPPSMLEQIQTFAAIMKAMRDLEPPRPDANAPGLKEIIVAAVKEVIPRAAGRGSDWGGLLEKALPLFAPIGMALVARLKPAGPPAPVIQPGPPQFTQFQPAPMRGPGSGVGAPVNQPQAPQAIPPAPAPAPAAPAPAVPAPAVQTVITEEMQGAVLWNHVTKQIVDRITHNETGDIVAASLDQMFPDIAVHMRNMNEQTLSVMVASDPELKKVKDDPRLPAFLKAFCGWFQGIEEGEDEGPEEGKVQ